MRLNLHVVGTALFTSLFAQAVNAGDITISAGTDFLFTQPGTFYNFPAPIGPQPLVGVPAFTGGSDTVIQRLGDADATTGAPINTLLTGLELSGAGGITLTLDPAHLADNTGTMSFLVTSPVIPGGLIGGSITDTLNVWFSANIPGVGTIAGHESFTSTGTWQATLPAGSNEVDPTTFKIVTETNTDPNGVHVVSSFGAVPEPSSLSLTLVAGAMLGGYGWRRSRARLARERASGQAMLASPNALG